MGDLYYYGARGLTRDQPLALQYFERAARLNNANGLCGAAAMYLKGEGCVKNTTQAIAYFEQAALQNSTRALNGLGYVYFYGQEVPKNVTKAYGYFLGAAEQLTDGDSLGNAALCLEHGLGVNSDMGKAVEFYKTAAVKFGHFDSVKAMGLLYMNVSSCETRLIECLQPLLTLDF